MNTILPNINVTSVYSHNDNPLLVQRLPIYAVNQTSTEPISPFANIKKNLMRQMGPTRVAANALIAAQLDQYQEIQYNPLLTISKPAVISDHLPVSFNIKIPGVTDIAITSWNMLADIHKNNNYENIQLDSLASNLFKHGKLDYFSSREEISKSWYFYDLASEMAKSGLFKDILPQFYTGKEKGIETFITFINCYYLSGKNALLKPHLGGNKRKDARAAIIQAAQSLFINKKNLIESDFYHSAVTALKIYYTLNEGSLSWERRQSALEKQTTLLQTLARNDVLLLQECTDPVWLVGQLNKYAEKAINSSFNFIVHKEGDQQENNDHCVIIYDQSKWIITDPDYDIVKFKLGMNKPALLVRLTAKEKATSLPQEAKSFIIGSLHYPGGYNQKTPLHTLIQTLNTFITLKKEKFFIAGDFNQTQNELDNKLMQTAFHLDSDESEMTINSTDIAIIEPDTYAAGGTMAGPDWDRKYEGKIIDMALSNAQAKGHVVDLKYFI